MNNKIAPATTRQPVKNYQSLDFENSWSFGLCDCCSDCKICCKALWCLPCYECVLITDAREFLCTYSYPGYLGNLRSKIRGTYRIKGKADNDAAVAFCCRCCAVVQMKRELIARGELKP